MKLHVQETKKNDRAAKVCLQRGGILKKLPSLDKQINSNYCNYMHAKLVRIGNSKGLRIPQDLIELYKLHEGESIELEARQDGILLRPLPGNSAKLPWELAYRQMGLEAAEGEEWADWDGVAGDGEAD